MITTEDWAIIGQAYTLGLAAVGVFAICWYVLRGINR